MKNSDKLSFGDAARAWLSDIRPGLKESSVARYLNILQLHLLPELEDIPVEEITKDQVSAFRTRLLSGSSEKNALSPATVSAIISVLKRVMYYASQEKDCRVVNLSNITVRRTSPQLRVLSLEEQQRLNRYLTGHMNLPNLGILLTLYTGLRIGELCALKWKHISLESLSLRVQLTMQRLQTFNKSPRTRIILTEPKSACSVRDIPVPDFLKPFLVAARKGPECFLLTGKPDIFLEPRSMQNHFERVMRACGITNVTFHTLRHTFATRCIEQGFDMKTLSEILGHSGVTITMNRYVHPSMAFKRENMNKLSALFEVEKNRKGS